MILIVIMCHVEYNMLTRLWSHEYKNTILTTFKIRKKMKNTKTIYFQIIFT